MSPARKESCESTSRVPFGCGWPSRYGTKGCIPLLVNNVVGSFSGTMGAEGITACPRALKNSRYFDRTSAAFIPETIALFYKSFELRHVLFDAFEALKEDVRLASIEAAGLEDVVGRFTLACREKPIDLFDE